VTQELPLSELIGFLLALVRTTAWMAISPPFNNRMMPRTVKLGCAAAISMVLAPKLPAEAATLEAGELFVMILTQIATGLALGFITMMLFNAVQMAGQLIDLFGGFTLSMAFDPLLNSQSSIFGRFYQLIATTMLFVINGHLMLIKGFMTSFDAVPLTGPSFENFTELVIKDIGMLMLAAVEIAGPLLAAYFLTEVALGFLSKAAPQLNVISFGFPLKILLTLLMVGSALPLIPGAMHSLVNDILGDGFSLLRGT
jgi:flagellar biosynthetic protein FliR